MQLYIQVFSLDRLSHSISMCILIFTTSTHIGTSILHLACYTINESYNELGIGYLESIILGGGTLVATEISDATTDPGRATTPPSSHGEPDYQAINKEEINYLTILISEEYIDYRSLAMESPFSSDPDIDFEEIWQNKQSKMPQYTLAIPIFQCSAMPRTGYS